MKKKEIITHISNWLKGYCDKSKTNGFVIGISGGIDSAVTSTLCALTGKRLIVLNLPIKQNQTEFHRSTEHIEWLKKNFKNVETQTVELSDIFKGFEKDLPTDIQDFLTMANVRSRVRMITLYAFASHHKLLVAGTGNKIEDFGIGFFTKYGDGGVDLSPIADLTKTEVYALAAELNIIDSIQKARPTDGLFADNRTDEDQIGATYPELEWAMEYVENNDNYEVDERQKEVMHIYTSCIRANKNKMEAIPVCLIPKEFKK
ncbi:MAG: NAD(+) synthase [Sphingobacteriaceae bacterium]|nr:NAD(+) synthase [Sphingobacteriaceae bacterium]